MADSLEQAAMKALEACPFCGNDPRYLAANQGFHTERVICDSCHFHLPPDVWNLRSALHQEAGEAESWLQWRQMDLRNADGWGQWSPCSAKDAAAVADLKHWQVRRVGVLSPTSPPIEQKEAGDGKELIEVAEMVAIDDGLGTVFIEFTADWPPAGTKLYIRAAASLERMAPPVVGGGA